MHAEGNKLFLRSKRKKYCINIIYRKLYWTNANHKSSSIERSNLDGTEHEVLINTDLFIPLDIVIDQNAKRIYWADDKEGVYFKIESAALDGIFLMTC